MGSRFEQFTNAFKTTVEKGLFVGHVDVHGFDRISDPTVRDAFKRVGFYIPQEGLFPTGFTQEQRLKMAETLHCTPDGLSKMTAALVVSRVVHPLTYPLGREVRRDFLPKSSLEGIIAAVSVAQRTPEDIIPISQLVAKTREALGEHTASHALCDPDYDIELDLKPFHLHQEGSVARWSHGLIKWVNSSV